MVWNRAGGPLPDIQRGTIAVLLQPIATGMSAPDYATSPVTARGPVAAGVYFLELRSNGVVRSQRVVLAR